MRRAASFILALSVFASCSSEDPAAAPSPSAPDAAAGDASSPEGAAPTDADAGAQPGSPRRGSRLAPRYRESADGFSAFLSIADTSLGDAVCAAMRATDGAVRCLPSEAPYLSSLLFADAACKTRLIDVGATCDKPTFALDVLDAASTCTARFAVHDVGAAHAGQIYEDQGGTCVAIASAPGVAYYAIGAARPPTDFVALTSGIEPIAGGIGITVVDGDDGSHFPQGTIVDVARGKACYRASAADAKMRCLPSGSASVAGFVDGACMKPAALVSPTCDAIFTADTAQVSDASNDGRVHVHALGAKQATKETYQRIDAATCSGPSSTSEDVYEVGAEIAASTFPEIGETNAGGTRLVSTRPVAGGIAIPYAIGLRDLVRDEKCSVMSASDGKKRCLPQGLTRSFSDDQCTVPIVVANGSTTPSIAIAPDASCPRRFAVHSLGAEIAPPVKSYTNFSGSCVGSAPPANAKIYALGAEIPPSSFVEVTEVVR